MKYQPLGFHRMACFLVWMTLGDMAVPWSVSAYLRYGLATIYFVASFFEGAYTKLVVEGYKR